MSIKIKQVIRDTQKQTGLFARRRDLSAGTRIMFIAGCTKLSEAELPEAETRTMSGTLIGHVIRGTEETFLKVVSDQDAYRQLKAIRWDHTTRRWVAFSTIVGDRRPREEAGLIAFLHKDEHRAYVIPSTGIAEISPYLGRAIIRLFNAESHLFVDVAGTRPFTENELPCSPERWLASNFTKKVYVYNEPFDEIRRRLKTEYGRVIHPELEGRHDEYVEAFA